MVTESWVNETLYPAWGQRFRVKRELARLRSAFQDIMIFESETHGRVMLLDGVVQITEGDEFVYQEMMVHPPLLAHGAAARVLIIGAGDGGVLKRVLQHRGVARAQFDQRLLQRPEILRHDRAVIAQPEAQVEGDLVVTGPAAVYFLAEVAKFAGKH